MACLQLTRNRLLSPPGPIKFGKLLSNPPHRPPTPLLGFPLYSSFLHLSSSLSFSMPIELSVSPLFCFFQPCLLFIALNTPPPDLYNLSLQPPKEVDTQLYSIYYNVYHSDYNCTKIMSTFNQNLEPSKLLVSQAHFLQRPN